MNLMDVKQRELNLEENIQMNDPYPNDSYPRGVHLIPRKGKYRTFKKGKQQKNEMSINSVFLWYYELQEH